MAIRLKGTLKFDVMVLGNELPLLKSIKEKLARGKAIEFEDLDFLLGLSSSKVKGRATDTVGLSSSGFDNPNLTDRQSELTMRTIEVTLEKVPDES